MSTNNIGNSSHLKLKPKPMSLSKRRNNLSILFDNFDSLKSQLDRNLRELVTCINEHINMSKQTLIEWTAYV